MIPCYVSGKGMHASDATWHFKTTVMALLQSSGLEFPAMPDDEFSRMVCDPIEYYDKDWPDWQIAHKNSFENEDLLITAFFLERDRAFQAEAQVAIFGFDEAGFGSGVNAMRFIHAGKPVLGFYNPKRCYERYNIHNVMQLALDYPEVVTLRCYRDVEEIGAYVVEWLGKRSGQQGR